MSSLLNAVVFMLFIFVLFGILGVQQFSGNSYRRCRFSEFPLEDGTWPFDPEIDYLCSPDGQGLRSCPEDRYCKEPHDANLSKNIDDPLNDSLIMYGITSFDNLPWAILTIFQMITLEGWSIVMYNLMDANIAWMAIIFCISIVIIGSFFLLDIVLAIVWDAFMAIKDQNAEEDDDEEAGGDG